MSNGKSDDEIIRTTHNTARFFTEHRQVAWVLLVGTLLWGVYAYLKMPQRKDPEVPVRVAVALCAWPGVNAEKIEQLVTRKIEERMAENSRVKRTWSVTRDSVAVVYVELHERVEDASKEFDDIKGKLDSIRDLPDGAGPVSFIKDFGDTAALMLTVSSPKISATEVELRALGVRRTIESARALALVPGRRMTLLYSFPPSISPVAIRRNFELGARTVESEGAMHDVRVLEGTGFTGLDGRTDLSEVQMAEVADRFVREHLVQSELHPDVWGPAFIVDPAETTAKLAQIAGDKYSYRELDDFTDVIQKTVQTVPQVSKVSRSGVLPEKIFLEYSQERVAAYEFQARRLQQVLSARNITMPGGVLEIAGKNLVINPSGELRNEKELGDLLLGASATGSLVYLRDLVDIERGYESPARYLNFYSWRDSGGVWRRTRAITLAIQMRPGEQIEAFGKAVDEVLAGLRQRLPEDLVIARTSDQPLQVKEGVKLFINSLDEAIVLVVLVALVGFWEWRSALLLAISIPITLAMTFGMMQVLGVDVQQVSIASLIIALGLLVDDPVVAGDAIKRDLAQGHPPEIAAWLGPTKLARAIMFATVTNIVAYLPFLLLSGDTGKFLWSLPVVLGCSLVASRLVSMTFLPLLGYVLLRPDRKPTLSIEEREHRGLGAVYYRAGTWLIEHRWKAFIGSLAFLAAGGLFAAQLKSQFFPKDLSYLSYVEVWLPEDAPLSSTNAAVGRAENVIRMVADEYGKQHSDANGHPRQILRSLTTFVGGGGPRFWFSISPELQQPNYAQIVVEVKDKHDTNHLIAPLQKRLSAEIAGARVDVRQLETGSPVGIPVSVRISGHNIPALRAAAAEVKEIFRSIPQSDRVRDDWGEESFVLKLRVDSDRANIAGLTNLDVAASSATAISGYPVGVLREGDKQIGVLARLRMEERARLSDIQNLYVYSLTGPQKAPLRQLSSIQFSTEPQRIHHRDQFRTVTVACFPVPGMLPSQIMNAARKRLTEFQKRLPPGFRMEIGGEEESQVKGFKELATVMAISVACIFLALVIQFNSAVKPIIVFAAIPYGLMGALIALTVMGAPFGFMAFLGIASLVGVIVSHVIVLFDFIEEAHAEGKSLEKALLQAGIVRLRPVMITVGATVLGLVPLALHGGPLWEPLCYAQIGGLTVATFITLLLVPVIYSILVLDLKIVSWDPKEPKASESNA